MIYRMPFLPIYLSTLLYDTLFHILYNDRPTESLIFFNSHQWDHKISVFSENVFKLKTENVRNEAGDTAISLQHQSPPWEVPIWVGVGDILGKLRTKVTYSSMRSSNLAAGWGGGTFLASLKPKSLGWHIIICWLPWFLTFLLNTDDVNWWIFLRYHHAGVTFSLTWYFTTPLIEVYIFGPFPGLLSIY